MWQIVTVAWFEFRWQCRRTAALLFWLSLMLFPLVQPTASEEAVLALVGSQSRLFVIAAPVMMMGVLSRDHMDGALPLLRITGLSTHLYPASKWLGLLGVQYTLLGGVWALSSLQVALIGDRTAWHVYNMLFLVTMPVAGALYTAVGLVAEGIFGNPWRMYPVALLIGVTSMQLDGPLTLAYRDLPLSHLYSSLQEGDWQTILVKWGLYVCLTSLLVGLYTLWQEEVGRRRNFA